MPNEVQMLESKTNLSMVSNNMIFHLENSSKPIDELLEIIIEFIKVAK